MCQMSILLEHHGQQEKVMENASLLEVTPEGITISTLFEEPKLLKDVQIKKIDFLGGMVTLASDEGGDND